MNERLEPGAEPVLEDGLEEELDYELEMELEGEAGTGPEEEPEAPGDDLDLSELNEELKAALKPFIKPKKRRIAVYDFTVLCKMLQKGFPVISVLLHDCEKSRSQELILKSIRPSLPVQFFDKEETARCFRILSKGRTTAITDLRALVEVPLLPCTKTVLQRYRKILVLDRLQNSMDVAKVIEVCHSFGVEAVMVTKNSLNPYQVMISKICHFKNLDIPFILAKNDPVARNRFLNSCGYVVFAMALDKNAIGFKQMWTLEAQRYAITVGNESSGLSKESIEASNYVVKIPMRNGVKSLNVAHACSIILYELARVQLPPLKEPDVVRDCEVSENTNTALEPGQQIETVVLEEPDVVRDCEVSENTNTALEPSRQVETEFLEVNTPPAFMPEEEMEAGALEEAAALEADSGQEQAEGLEGAYED